jgi:hypothetical protein
MNAFEHRLVCYKMRCINYLTIWMILQCRMKLHLMQKNMNQLIFTKKCVLMVGELIENVEHNAHVCQVELIKQELLFFYLTLLSSF